MTHTEIYRAWHTLPEYFKEEVRQDYAKALEANELDPKNERIDAHIILLERYFGKHNLTATEEEKPRFKIGDCVKVYISNNSVYRKGDVCLVMSVIKDNNGYHYELDRSRAMLISEEFLGPYTEERETEKGEIQKLEEELQDLKSKHLDRMLHPEKDYTYDVNPDWLAYRMELAKEIAVELIRSGRDTTFLAESTSLIVDGIVRLLKGGEK